MTNLILTPIDPSVGGSWQLERERKRLRNQLSDAIEHLQVVVEDERMLRDETGANRLQILESQLGDVDEAQHEAVQAEIAALTQALTPELRARLITARRATNHADRAYEAAKLAYEDFVLARLRTDDASSVEAALALATKEQIERLIWNDAGETTIPQAG